MINYDSIISVFNEKGTLLKWLKKVEKALKESVLTNVEILQGQDDSIAFKFTFQDNTSITTDYVTISATLLHNLIIGSDTVVVDLNELQNKLIVKLDEEYKKTLATKTDIENLESELATKTNTLQNQVAKQQTQITDLQNNKIEKTDGVITSNLIASDSITTSKIPDNAITSAKIVNHQVTDDKLTLITLNKINNSLQLPEAAPTETELVGIDTNKAQTNISIGDGLTVENGTLKATGGGGGGGAVLYTHYMHITYRRKAIDIIFTIINNKPNLRSNFESGPEIIADLINKGYILANGSCDYTNANTKLLVTSIKFNEAGVGSIIVNGINLTDNSVVKDYHTTISMNDVDFEFADIPTITTT